MITAEFVYNPRALISRSHNVKNKTIAIRNHCNKKKISKFNRIGFCLFICSYGYLADKISVTFGTRVVKIKAEKFSRRPLREAWFSEWYRQYYKQ